MFFVHSQFRLSSARMELLCIPVRIAVLLPVGVNPAACSGFPGPPGPVLRTRSGGLLTEPPAPQPPDLAYVRGVDVPLLDQLGPASSTIGSLNNGDKVEVLGTRPRWTHVRTADGPDWMDAVSLPRRPRPARSFHSLTLQSASPALAGHCPYETGRPPALEPDRDSETFYGFAERR